MIALIENKYSNLSAIPNERLIDYRQQLFSCFAADHETSSIHNAEIQRVGTELYARHINDPFNDLLASAVGKAT